MSSSSEVTRSSPGATRSSGEVTRSSRPKRRLPITWLILSIITLGYLALDNAVDEHGAPRASTFVTTTAIVLALIKMRLIFQEFMEVRHAPPLLARLTDLWIVLIGTVLIGSYVIGRAVH